MAIRYSGDVEVRLGYNPKAKEYRGTVRDPYLHWRGVWRPSILHRATRSRSDAYDEAARELVMQAQASAKKKKKSFQLEIKHGHIILRRVFQAPCPVSHKKTARRKSGDTSCRHRF